MKDSTINLICFVLGMCLFLTIARIYPVSRSTDEYRLKIEKEGIISKTKESDYPKHLDARFFLLGSFLIPVSAFLFWRAQFRFAPLRRIYLPLALVWICVALI